MQVSTTALSVTQVSTTALPVTQVCLLQVMHTRDDHVVTVYYPDDTTVVEHADGTRITTVMQDITTVATMSDTLETGVLTGRCTAFSRPIKSRRH